MSKNLSKYLDVRDKNGILIRDWAEQSSPGVAQCRVCEAQLKIKFFKGKARTDKPLRISETCEIYKIEQ